MPNLDVSLRAVQDEDILVLYEQQLDPIATEMAAFPSREWPNFEAHWGRIRREERNVTRTILANGEVAGNIGSFVLDDQRFVGFWLGQQYWGQGIATKAINALLLEITSRPVFAHVAEHNVGSRRALEKNNFRLIDRQRAEDDGVVELVFQLN